MPQVNGYDCGVYVLCIAEVLCVTADPAQAAQVIPSGAALMGARKPLLPLCVLALQEIQSITPEAATVRRDKFRQMLQR